MLEMLSSLVWFNYKVNSICTRQFTSLPCWKYKTVNIFHMHNPIWCYCCTTHVLTSVRWGFQYAVKACVACLLGGPGGHAPPPPPPPEKFWIFDLLRSFKVYSWGEIGQPTTKPSCVRSPQNQRRDSAQRLHSSWLSVLGAGK